VRHGPAQRRISWAPLSAAALLLCLALLGSGCAAQHAAGRAKGLKTAAFELQQSYRWLDEQRALPYIDKSLRPALRERMMRTENPLEITEVELQRVEVTDPEARKGEVELLLQWHATDSISLRTTRLELSMEYRKELGWVVVKQEEPGQEGSGPLDLLP